MSETRELSEWEIKKQAEEEATYQRIKALYLGVAGHMPNGWSFVEKDNPHQRDRVHMLALVDESGREITLSVGWNAKGKVTVGGNWPHRLRNDQTGELFDGGQIVGPRDVRAETPTGSEDYPSINVSEAKGYKLIAADIMRRFLPDYVRIYDKCVARRNESDRYAELQANNWKAFKGNKLLSHWTATSYTSYLSIEPGYGDCRMESAENVSLHLRSLPVSVALSILEQLESLLEKAKP